MIFQGVVHRVGIKFIDRELSKEKPDLGKRIPMYFIKRLINSDERSEDEIKCFKKLKAYVKEHPDEVPESIRELLYSPLEEVPDDIRPLILAHLDSKNQASLAQTSSTVNEMVKEHKANEWRDRFNELSDIKKLFKERLEGNKEAEDAFKALSLPTVKIGANSTQEECRKEAEKLHDQIISALTKVNDKTLEDLLDELRNVNKEDRHKPIYYKSGWRQARDLYKNADLAKELPDDERNKALRRIAIKLAEARHFKGAIDLANTITNINKKNDTLCDIAIEMSEARHFKGAIDLANTITNINTKDNALRRIALKMAKEKNFDGAIELTNELSNEDEKDDTLCEIALKMAKARNIKVVKRLPNRITDRYRNWGMKNDDCWHSKNDALRDIAFELAELGDFEGAEKLVSQLDDSWHSKNDALRDIATKLTKARHFKDAKRLANTITNSAIKNDTLCEIALVMIKAKNFDGVQELAVDISDDYKKSSAFINIAIELAKASDFKGAEKLANTITNIDKKDNVLRQVTLEIAKSGDFEGAERLANTISDESKKNYVLRWISVCMVEAENFEGAERLANTITNSTMKDDALRQIAIAMDKRDLES